MLMPSIFGENLFDDWFDEFPFYDFDKSMKNTEKKLYGKKASRIMKTDIKEKKDSYELEVDLPGFTKDEINASIEDGYLTISAAKGLDKDEKEKDSGKYIRKERYAGACQRSFYVGEGVKQEDVKAEFKRLKTGFFPLNAQDYCKVNPKTTCASCAAGFNTTRLKTGKENLFEIRISFAADNVILHTSKPPVPYIFRLS